MLRHRARLVSNITDDSYATTPSTDKDFNVTIFMTTVAIKTQSTVFALWKLSNNLRSINSQNFTPQFNYCHSCVTFLTTDWYIQ